MIKTEIVWHNASEERPEKSGDYLTIKIYPGGSVWSANLAYSKIADRFNQSDGEDPPYHPIKVSYWAEMPRLPEVSADG